MHLLQSLRLALVHRAQRFLVQLQGAAVRARGDKRSNKQKNS